MRLGFDGAGYVKSRIVLNLSGECCPNLPAIVLVSGEDCPNPLFEPSHESGVVGTPQRFTRVAQPNVGVRFALAGYVLE